MVVSIVLILSSQCTDVGTMSSTEQKGRMT